jgi:hypothetical protein
MAGPRFDCSTSRRKSRARCNDIDICLSNAGSDVSMVDRPELEDGPAVRVNGDRDGWTTASDLLPSHVNGV